MKRKGFTLIELLAIIVILAIIALIATPTILGVIEQAKKGSAEQSALGYIDAVEKQIAIGELDSSKAVKDRSYSVEELTNLGVTVKGSIPDNGNLLIEDGQVKNYILGFHEYVVENGTAEKSKTTKYENGTAVYYNPVTGESCNSSEAVSTTGTKTGCMKWYIFNDKEGSSTVNMILDHNTTALVAWNSTGNNKEMKEIAVQLLNDTKDWNSSLNARLITADEIAKITGNTSFNSESSTKSDSFYFDSNNHTLITPTQGASKYAWLFDYTYDCTNYGCNIPDESNYGYWTSTPVAKSSNCVWRVLQYGTILSRNVEFVGDGGIRPVITIPKSII